MIEQHRTHASDSPTLESGEEGPAIVAAPPFRPLLIVSTADVTKAYEFGVRATLTIGRNAPADILFDDPSLSRMHACFRCDENKVQVRDLGSRNGTWVNGQRVEEATLSLGSTAVLGGVSVSIQMAMSSEAAMLGLVSSASMLQRIDEECVRSRMFHRPLSVLIVRPVEPDGVGARHFSAHCLGALRAVDRAGLYDRDALIALLPEADAETAAGVARRMLEAAQDRVGLVCGLSSFPDSGSSPEQLVSAAWQALRETSASQPVAAAPRLPLVHNALLDATFHSNYDMLELKRVVERVAPHRISVLLLGETGTGKELIARELHERGPRPDAPLRVVNCAAIPRSQVESVLFGQVSAAEGGADQPGVFVQADGGTIVLDEVGELSAEAQAALLRVLDVQRICPVGACNEIQVDVRVIATTHRDLAAMTEQGTFRLDLYHRLNSVVVRVPPLRDRREEIAALANHFLERVGMGSHNGKPRISDRALEQLRAYKWPGNVRELRNVIERAAALCSSERIDVRDLPSHVANGTASPASDANGNGTTVDREGLDLRASLQEHEARLIAEALRRSRGNQRRAAGFLRLPLRTFERKLKTLGDRVQRPVS